MKIQLPEIKKKKKTEETECVRVDFGLYDPYPDSFEVMVRNDEQILKSAEDNAETGWKKDLVLNLSGACILMAAVSIFLTSAYNTYLVPYAAAGVILYLGITVSESLKPGKLRWIIAAVAGVILVVTMVIFHSRIGGGLALLSGYFYDTAEQAQAYIYARFHVPDDANSNPELCMRLAVIWASCLLGLITALPPLSFRRGMCAFLAGLVMMAFAYYGVIPSWVCIGVILVAGIAALSRGSLLSTLPLLLVAVIIFGAVVLIDPGENYAVSRANENIRDRFALLSSYLQPPQDEDSDLSELQKQDQLVQEQQEKDAAGSSFMMKMIRTLSVIFIILAAIGAAAWIFWRKLKKRIDSNRAGIDSDDPGEAITAMFPYCVRWLESYGIEAAGRPFSALTADLKEDMSREYAYKYEDMYALWQEAAYSDHEMTERQKREMSGFLQETVDLIKGDTDFAGKVRTMIKYAL